VSGHRPPLGWGPAGPRKPWTLAMASRWRRSRSGDQAIGRALRRSGSAADAPLGRGAVALPGFPWPLPSRWASCCSRPLSPLPAGGAQRGAAVAMSGQGKPTRQPRSGAVGQWAAVVRIGGAAAAGSPWLRSLERVWTLGSMTLLVLPLESLPAALTVKGAGGRRQQGRTPMLVLAGWLLFRFAARQLCGSLNQEPPRSSWATRPQISG
jgi:hypothetical protein